MCDATERIKKVAQNIELWNVDSRRKLGVGWKGLGGDSKAKHMGQWAIWPLVDGVKKCTLVRRYRLHKCPLVHLWWVC